MRRIIFLIAIFLLTLSPLIGQNPPITLPADGDWPTIVGDSIMLIGPKQEALTEEQRYFNPPYLLVYPGKEHLKEQMIRAALCDCDPTKPNRRIGVFSVAPDKQVSFSQGNLQYFPAAKLWKFADTQYEYLGNANKYLKPTFRNWVDLFGWSANNTTAPFGVSTSTNAAGYAGDFVDWGTNTICGDKPGTWRTLSVDEWGYLFQGRKNATQLYSKGNIDGLRGMIILPDNWVMPEGLHFTAQPTNLTMELDINTYTQAEWQRMEEAGAVFLCPTGRRDGTKIDYLEYYGGYWSSSKISNSNHVCHMYYNYKSKIFMTDYKEGDYSYGTNGRAVRLVHDTIVPEVIPEPCMVVKVNDTLSINMMCVEGGTFTMGDDNTSNASPAHQVTLSDYYIGQTEVTQALWKAVMGNVPTGNKNPSYPVGYVSYADCQDFIVKLNELTSLHFQLPTEAEWEYAAMGGNRSHGYIYSGSNTIDDVAWYDQNSENKLHHVGAKQPNELGIYDMSGNAWEWCADYHGKYTAENQINPQGPAAGTGRVIRSGSFRTTADRCTNKHRQAREADYPDSHITLRLVLHDTVPVSPEPEYVDLGLSVKWATFNVGATSPEDYGDYFAWGETEPKEEYNWATYKWYDGTSTNMTKYNTSDGKITLELEDDAAHVNWGGKWRMPTEEEFTELREKCTWTWTTQNGVKGYKITGPSGNSIFIPAAGFHYENGFNYGENGDYWSAEAGLPNNGIHLNFYPDKQIKSTSYRYFGFPIRPVYDDRVTLTVIPTPEDAKVSFHCSGYQWAGNSITVDKGKDVLYQVTNVDAGYLSQGDSIYKLTKDSVLYVTLHPFSDGNWVVVDNSEYTKQEGYYVSRNKGAFASYSVWNYYVLPVLPGETYRVRSIAGQHAALWMAANTAPDAATNTPPTKISCCANRGVAAYVADEVTIPDGAKYLIINSRNDKEMMVERKVPDPCMVVKVNDTLSINLMCVEGGTMYIGRGDTVNRPYRQRPLRQVTISDFYLGQTEVTQELWLAIMGENPTYFPCDTCLCHPVDSVSIDEVLLFIERLNSLTGYNFRLPTEAEWEYAARGGVRSKGYAYAGSDNVNEVAWCRVGDSRGGTPHPVAQKRPNELGLYDMHGNLWEFVHDKFVDDINIYPSVNPTGPGGMRGSATGCGSAYYSALMPENTWGWVGTGGGRSRWFGFRLALSDQDPFVPITIGKYRFHMMYVQGGTFMMGSDAPNAEPNEKPVHEVILSDYYIGQTEVTQKLWKLVMGNDNNPSANKGDELPVTNITWDEAQVFVEKLSEMTGLHFRLPTEAEWEYAARGGQRSQGYTYAGSDDIDEVGWYNVNSANKTHNVGQKMPNELGIYDMTGNVYEFCQDWYGPYSAESQDNPTGPTSSTKNLRVCRGGAFVNPSNVQLHCRVTRRGMAWDDNRYAHGGLRIVLDPNLKPTPVPPEPEYVDLGLSVKWATFNVGATSPEDYGDYFAWGETETKETYSWATYKWCQGTANTFTKYCSNSQYGNADYKTTLDPEDDAAIVHLGGNWRMPTIEEWMELKQNCTWKKITINGITGCQVTAKNGNSIFLPRAGLRMSNILYAADSVGYYASISHLPQFHKEDYASYMLMYDSSISKSSAVRYYGLPIRPVYDDRPDPCLMVKVNDTLSINMMCVEGGTFMMGAMEGDEIAKDDEKPAHKVTLTYDYHIMQTEVTQSLWEAVTGEDIYVAQTKMANASKPAYVGGNYPMYYVRMNDALEFIDKLNAMTGMHFRLPTEAEWEYAARGGNKSKGYLYAGSNNADDVGWYTGRGMHHVAKLKPNELGIYDMSGNVGEMCLDYGTYGETYKAGDAVNPRGNIRANGNRFWRGGSYTHSKDSIRVSQRSSYTPSWGGTWLGLRLVLAKDNDFRTIRVGNSYFDMSFVKGGTFMMGSDAPDAEKDEQPVHEVTLSDYYIGQTEVTQHLWQAVMGSGNNPSATKGNNLPVTNISWDEAQAFVERLSELTGMRFRLPTEAEWEYAARGGQKSKGYTYAGSDDIDEVGWYASNSDNKTHSVGQKLPNELGMYDMTGNVWEWCTDTFDNNSEGHKEAVLRGGAYDNQASTCQIASSRALRKITHITHFAGFRVVLEPEKHYRYGYTQEDWDAATSSWGHTGRGHAPADQSCIQGTMVRGIRLKVARVGSLNVYKVPSLLEKNEDNFELVATLTTDSTGVQDFDFAEPIYIAPNECLVFGKPSEEEPTLRPCWFSGNGNSLPDKAKGVAHYIGTEEASIGAPNGSLMVEFY